MGKSEMITLKRCKHKDSWWATVKVFMFWRSYFICPNCHAVWNEREYKNAKSWGLA